MVITDTYWVRGRFSLGTFEIKENLLIEEVMG